MPSQPSQSRGPNTAPGRIRRALQEMPKQRKSEYAQLIIAFFGMILCTLIVVDMLARGWSSRGQTFHLIWGLSSAIDPESYALLVIPVGIYLGLVIVAVFDYFKRVQGVLLMIGTILTGIGLTVRGLLIPDVPWLSFPTLPLFLLGIGVGAVVFGGAVRAIDRGRPLQFPRAYRSLLWLLIIVTGLGFLEAHIQYQAPMVGFGGSFYFRDFYIDGLDGNLLFLDLVGSVGLIRLMAWFTGHESEKEVVIIGPTGSGKTWLFGGLNYYLENQNEYNPNAIPTQAEGAVQGTTGKMRAQNFDDIESTNEATRLGFQFVHGDLLKQRVKVKSLDYSGEALQYFDILDPEEDDIDAYNLEEALDNAEGASSARRLGRHLSEIVYHAECVGMVVPLDQHAKVAISRGTVPEYLDPDNLQTRNRMDKSAYHTKYEDIAREYDKDKFIIATMADIAKFDYEATKGTTAVTEWYQFREHVTEEFTKPEILGITQYLQGDDKLVHPIYFKIDPDNPKTPEGNIKPDLNPNDGFPGLRRAKDLLDRIGR